MTESKDVTSMTRHWERTPTGMPVGADGDAWLPEGVGFCVRCGQLLESDQRGSLCSLDWNDLYRVTEGRF